MFPKRSLWIFLLLAVLFVAALAVHPAQVSAAQITETVTNSCLTCHEDLYYLHDTGKWYCIAEHKDRCVDCHAGDPATLNKDTSHLGLIAHPQQNNGEKCLECHPQDSQERLVTFAQLGGYKTMPEAKAYTPSIAAKAGFPQVIEVNPLSAKLPWVIGGCLAFGLWLALVLFSPLKP